MGDSTIEWTDKTWNPIRGCAKVSPGCQHCYAASIAARFSGKGLAFEGYATRSKSGVPNWTGKVTCLPDKLLEPTTWKKPSRVFVNSMSDWLHEDVPNWFIKEMLDVMTLEARQHTYQLLTKRPERLTLLERHLGVSYWPDTLIYFRNLWLGVSIENADYIGRAEQLKRSSAWFRARGAKLFISAEPLLGPLTDLDTTGIDWLIAGAESGPGARPMNEDWVRELRDKCQKTGTAFFYKQSAVNGKKIPTPELDGRQWLEFPIAGKEAVHASS